MFNTRTILNITTQCQLISSLVPACPRQSESIRNYLDPIYDRIGLLNPLAAGAYYICFLYFY